MATHSSILAWENPWTEEPGGLQSTGSQKSNKESDLVTKTTTTTTINAWRIVGTPQMVVKQVDVQIGLITFLVKFNPTFIKKFYQILYENL